MQRTWAFGLALAIVLFIVPGCGRQPGTEPTAPVTGTVTLDGQPIAGVSIAFIPQRGRPASGLTDASGKFTLSTFDTADGAVVGSHKVMITEPPDDAQPMPGEPGWEKWKQPKARFPAKYRDANQSGFTAEVESGKDNEFTFEMSSQSSKR